MAGKPTYFDFVKLHNQSKSKVYDTSVTMNREPTEHEEPAQLEGYKEGKIHHHMLASFNKNYQLSEKFSKIEDPLEASDLQDFCPNQARATTHAHDDFTSADQPTANDTNYYPLVPLEFHGDFQDYAVYRTGRAPDPSTRLPASSIWQTLTKHGMKTWLSMHAEDKQKLVACLRPDLMQDQTPDPNSTKPISRRAYEHSIVADQATAPSTITAPSQLSTPEADDARSAYSMSLLGFTKRLLKSTIALSVADNPSVLYKKEGNTYIPVGSSSLVAKFHYWSLPEFELLPEPESLVLTDHATMVYHSNKTNVSAPGYAMVDRGANGCITGNDACLISKDIPPRYVNVPGINNHQIQNIPIATTCGAYSVSFTLSKNEV
eukprot:jgi/Psemu1/28372/gm1.28372_g